jgi:esterase/lipase superfamily enzyme
VNRQYHKWFSWRLNREMELLVFGHGGARVIIFPTRQGRFFDYENWGLVDALSSPIESGSIQLYCVDSLDSESLCCHDTPPQNRLSRHKQFEQYILEEVIPFTASVNSHPELVAHGCSIGAYHAVNISFRNPGLFRRVVALSGRYDLTRQAGSFPDLFGGHYDSDIYFHTPNHFVPNLSEPSLLEKLRSMRISLAVGESDPFAESNRRLSSALWEKGVWHSLDFQDGEAHRARYWRQMVPRYF